MSDYINNCITMTNGMSITEDSVLADPNINTSTLRPAATTMARNQTKVQPHYLSNEIQDSGNAGATLMVQNTNTGSVTHMTNKFYLQAMDLQLKERVQIMETFGKPVASFFGETARVYNFSGVALEADTQRKAHKGEYFHGTSLIWLYEEFMRGTKLVDAAAIAILNVANHSVYGYPLQLTYRSMSDMQHAIQFSFSMFVKDHHWEIPQVVDRVTLEKNIYMNKGGHEKVKKLENLRKGPLKLLSDKLKMRANKEWKDLQQSEAENKGTATLTDVGGALVSSSGEVYEDLTAAIEGHFKEYQEGINDYIAGVKDIYDGNVPTQSQANVFGFLQPATVPQGVDENADWTDNFVTTAYIAFQWMPWSDTTGAANQLTQEDIDATQANLTSGTFLSDIATEYSSLTGDESFALADTYNAANDERGAYASAFQTLIQNVDRTLLNKLNYYYTTRELSNIDKDLTV